MEWEYVRVIRVCSEPKWHLYRAGKLQKEVEAGRDGPRCSIIDEYFNLADSGDFSIRYMEVMTSIKSLDFSAYPRAKCDFIGVAIINSLIIWSGDSLTPVGLCWNARQRAAFHLETNEQIRERQEEKSAPER